MDNQKFIIEVKNPLNRGDFIRLRFLYMPIIGKTSIILFSLLNDINLLNKEQKIYSKWIDIKNLLEVSFQDLEIAKNKLEAVGLLTTFEKSNNSFFIYSLNKPSITEVFKKNCILYKKLISKVGEQLFEKIHFNFKIPILLKDEYKDVTLKYQEVFDIENNFNENNTLETPLYNYDSIEEAIQKLNSLQFINYLTEKKPSPSQINMINRINIQNFNHFSLNLILNYSFEKNGKIVNAFVEKIANDFISRNIFSFEEVEKELENAKNNSPKTNVEIEKTPNINKKWEDIFDDLGIDI